MLERSEQPTAVAPNSPANEQRFRALAEELSRLNRLYAVLSQVNEALVRKHSREELFDQVCRIAVEHGEFKLAWVGLLDQETYAVTPVAWAGMPDEYVQRIRVYADDRPEGRGPTGTSIRENRRYICNDFFGTPATLPWREAATQAGIRASAAFPIACGGVVCGALTLYSGELNFFGEKEIKLLDEVAMDLSYGLDRLEEEAQRQRAEAALQQAHDELERRVEERTAELAAANQELESFAFSVSHDLRAPLRAIDGWSYLLRKAAGDRLDERSQEYLALVRSEAQRMGQLIDALLKLSRLARGEIRWEPVDLTQLAHEVEAELRQGNPERVVELVIAPDLRVEGDPELLRAVLRNLLGNAWKFTKHSEHSRIEFGSSPCSDARVFFVRDNGAGFNMACVTRIFTPFQRLHDATEFPGTGIGLATVQRIIRRHGGKVWAEGAVGQGATFYFSLP